MFVILATDALWETDHQRGVIRELVRAHIVSTMHNIRPHIQIGDHPSRRSHESPIQTRKRIGGGVFMFVCFCYLILFQLLLVLLCVFFMCFSMCYCLFFMFICLFVLCVLIYVLFVFVISLFSFIFICVGGGFVINDFVFICFYYVWLSVFLFLALSCFVLLFLTCSSFLLALTNK